MGANPREFDRDTLPWLDRFAGDVDAYVGALREPANEPDLREQLLHWVQFGFVVLPGAIEPELIDAYLADVDELFATREAHRTFVNVEGYGERPVSACSAEQLAIPHLRIMDFHNASVAGKRMALHPRIVAFLRHLFRDTPVGMQTLTFLHGSEQVWHQDYAFVVSSIPSHLAASWIALEDVSQEAGPLGYYSGSHTIRKFDWGNGIFLTPESSRNERDFARHIEAECRRMNLREQVLLARKGDVFIWHAALAHRGTPATRADLTRKSFVTHYSSVRGYPRDRRRPEAKPTEYRINGGLVYGDPRWPEEEDVFRRGAKIGAAQPAGFLGRLLGRR
jgi:ectoine hydroxylase-related dioxygenase (phytanoyl-CoA dioxygenase family)